MTDKPFLPDTHGVRLPQAFAAATSDQDLSVSGVPPEDWTAIEAGPGHADYWDAWGRAVDNATVTRLGARYSLRQAGALWLVPEA